MGLLNLLLGDGDKNQPPAPAPQDAPTQLSGITAEARPNVTVAPPAKAPGLVGGAYNNTPELSAIKSVAAQYPEDTHGNGLGLSNLIGAHGTLRNILGTLGDAFLIQSGHTPIHAEAAYRQQVANAAAGFENDPGAAAARIAATGAPDSMNQAQKLYDTGETTALRKAQQENTNEYRRTQQQATSDWRDQQTAAKVAAQVKSIAPYASAIVNNPKVTDKDSYTKAYTRAVTMAKRYDPNATGADVGLIDPEDWEPGMNSTTGITQGQNLRNEATGAALQQRTTAANQRNATTQRGQNISAGNAAARNATTQRGQDMTATRAAAGKTKLAIPGLTVGGAPAANSKPVPTPADRAYLKAHPEKAAAFKAHFGTL